MATPQEIANSKMDTNDHDELWPKACKKEGADGG